MRGVFSGMSEAEAARFVVSRARPSSLASRHISHLLTPCC